MSAWQALARLFGVREDQVDDVLASERSARATLSRRGFLLGAVAGAIVVPLAGKAFSFPKMRPPMSEMERRILSMARSIGKRGAQPFTYFVNPQTYRLIEQALGEHDEAIESAIALEDVRSDIYVPSDRIYGIPTDSFRYDTIKLSGVRLGS